MICFQTVAAHLAFHDLECFSTGEDTVGYTASFGGFSFLFFFSLRKGFVFRLTPIVEK